MLSWYRTGDWGCTFFFWVWEPTLIHQNHDGLRRRCIDHFVLESKASFHSFLPLCHQTLWRFYLIQDTFVSQELLQPSPMPWDIFLLKPSWNAPFDNSKSLLGDSGSWPPKTVSPTSHSLREQDSLWLSLCCVIVSKFVVNCCLNGPLFWFVSLVTEVVFEAPGYKTNPRSLKQASSNWI